MKPTKYELKGKSLSIFFFAPQMKEKCLGPMRTLIRPWPVHVFMPEQSGFERLCLIFFSTCEESSQSTKHANKIIILIF